MGYKNHEGYSDPTTGAALANIMREYRAQRRESWKRQYEIRNRPKVYVVSRYAGDVEKNAADAIRCCRFAIGKKMIPVASHLLYPAMCDDAVPEERELGTQFGLALLAVCDQVWIFTNNGYLSPGMQAEEQEAKRLKKPIRYFDLKEVVS